MLLAALFLFLGNPKTIFFIIFVLVLFFGAKRIPELFKGVGQGVREFKDATRPEQPANPNYSQPANPNYNPQAPGYNQGGYAQQPPYPPQAPNQMPPAPYANPNDQPAR